MKWEFPKRTPDTTYVTGNSHIIISQNNIFNELGKILAFSHGTSPTIAPSIGLYPTGRWEIPAKRYLLG